MVNLSTSCSREILASYHREEKYRKDPHRDFFRLPRNFATYSIPPNLPQISQLIANNGQYGR
nr:unnamed protein product [Callosobruchus chinensis]